MRPPPFATRLPQAHRLVAVLLIGGSVAATAQQTATITISNFNVFPGEYYPPPYASQPKSQLQGNQGHRLSPDRYRVTQARLTTFRQDGSREMVVQAPECIYDQGSRSATSAGPLKMGTADDRFLIEGVGFLWQQTNSSISISNEVHTVVQAEMLARPAGVSSAVDSAKGSEPLHIFSRQFDYSGESGVGNYRENVRVVGTNLGLTSRLMTVQVPMKERQLQTITADGNVAIDYSGVRATGERAVYRADTGLADITGQPRWSTEQREGSADQLVIDATNRILRANGQARLRMTGQTFGTFGAHNAPAAPAPLTNHYVEIHSDSYELGTNAASFRKNVRAREWAAEQVRSTLNCGELTAWYSGTNQLQRLVADHDVVIEQQDEQLRAGRAVYTSTNGLLELTDQPTWRSGAREGRGERMVMVVPENELSVQGDAYLKLPANEAGRTAGPGTGATVTNQFAELFSEQYVVRPQVALFEGKVRLAHPQLQMTCDHLAVHSAADKQTGQNLTAEHSVVFDLLSSDGEKVHGTCQKAFYDYSIRGGQTNDVLELTGNPILETTNGSVQNSMLILDRARNKLLVPSVEQVRKANAGTESRRYRIALAVGAIPTNRFPMLRK